MTEREAFVRAIVEDPRDTAVRLIFADWLSDHGEEDRAEFIRVQCELASRWPGGHPHVLPMTRENEETYVIYKVLCCRERELLKANIGSWTDGLPESFVTKECPSCLDRAPDWETGVVECRQCDCTGSVFDEDNVEFRCGFVEVVCCNSNEWLEFGARIVSSQPVLSAEMTDRTYEFHPDPVRWARHEAGLPYLYATPQDVVDHINHAGVL